MKYNEQYILDEVSEYIESTYAGHYVAGNSETVDDSEKLQVNDLIMSLGHGEGAFISNAIEYLARYGKKDGRNIVDLHKAVHNIVLLINLNHIQSDKCDEYGDFGEYDSDSDSEPMPTYVDHPGLGHCEYDPDAQVTPVNPWPPETRFKRSGKSFRDVW